MPETRLTEVFIRERQFFKSVTPATLKWYRYSFHVFSGCHLENPPAVSAAELASAIKERIVKITPNQAAISINSCLRVVKAFLRWCLEEGHLKEIRASQS